MRAIVKPRKQLEYEFKRDGGHREDGNFIRGWKFLDDTFFNDDMFNYCLKEIYFLKEERGNLNYYFGTSMWEWKKEWFIPNSFKEDSDD